jgi:hypothetical protein
MSQLAGLLSALVAGSVSAATNSLMLDGGARPKKKILSTNYDSTRCHKQPYASRRCMLL